MGESHWRLVDAYSLSVVRLPRLLHLLGWPLHVFWLIGDFFRASDPDATTE